MPIDYILMKSVNKQSPVSVQKVINHLKIGQDVHVEWEWKKMKNDFMGIEDLFSFKEQVC